MMKYRRILLELISKELKTHGCFDHYKFLFE